MTVTYSLDVSTSGFFTFTKLLFRWRGSVYKALWKELVGFLVIYFSLHLMYTYGLNATGQEVFTLVAEYCDKAVGYIPLSFILGFYVSIVFKRWWGQFEAIAWPDSATLFVGCYLEGPDAGKAKLYRRTISRYLNLSAALGLRNGSSAVKKRFPTMEHLIQAGMMTEDEYKAFEAVPTRFAKQWVPCQWAMNLSVIARKEGLIKSDVSLIELVVAINKFRLLVRDTAFYDWMSIPLIYTQVVTLAVYSYFAACLMGRQHPDLNDYKEFTYFPISTILQFMFYVGWLKTGYVFADDNAFTVPPMSEDVFWDTQDVHIPHTAASYGIKSSGFEGSTCGIKVPRSMADLVVEDTQLPYEENLAKQADEPEKLSETTAPSLPEKTRSAADVPVQAKKPENLASLATDQWTTEFMRRVSRVFRRYRSDPSHSRPSSVRSNKGSDADKGANSLPFSRKIGCNVRRKISPGFTRPLGSRPGSWIRRGSIVNRNGAPPNASAGPVANADLRTAGESNGKDVKFVISSSESP